MAMQSTDLRVDVATCRDVIDKLLHNLRAYYVFPAIAAQIERILEERVRDGAYDTITTVPALCSRLTADVKAISHDQHLYVKYTPVAQPLMENVFADPNVADTWHRTAIVKNFDIHSVMWLPGNIKLPGSACLRGWRRGSRGAGCGNNIARPHKRADHRSAS